MSLSACDPKLEMLSLRLAWCRGGESDTVKQVDPGRLVRGRMVDSLLVD